MATLTGFDASTVAEMNTFSAIPEGQYPVIATASEMKATKNGQGEYLQFTFEVLDGQYKGAKIWSRLNLKNANATAVDIAQRELSAICKAVGVLRPNDSSELHNKPLMATVKIERDDRGRENNSITKYDPAGATSMTSSLPSQANHPINAPSAPAAAPWAR